MQALVPELSTADADFALEELAALWFEFADRWAELGAPVNPAQLAEWRGYLWSAVLLADAAPELVDASSADLLDEAARIAARYPDPEGPAQAVWLLAETLVAMNELDTAEFAASWALDAFPRAVATTPMLWRLSADAARLRGSWDEAYERLDAMEVSLDELDEIIARGSDRFRESFEPFALSQRSRLYGARGQLWLALGVLDQSIELLEEGEALAADSGVATSREALLGILLDWRMQSGDYAGVIRELDEAEAEMRLVGPTSAVFEVIRATAEMQLELKDPSRPAHARERLLGCLESEFLDSSLRENVFLLLAELALLEGDLDASRRHLDEAAAIEAQGSDVPTHRRATRAALEAGHALARGSAPQALRETFQTLRDAHQALLDEWAAASTKKRGALGFLHTSPRRRVLGELFRMALAVEGRKRGAITGLEALLATQARGLLSRDLGGDRQPSVEAFREELLGPGHGGLVYLPSEYRSHLFIVDGADVEHVELPSYDELRALVRPLERVLAAPTLRGREAQRASALLADVLLPDEARTRMARWNAVTVVGSELLGTVPFDALVVDGERLLGEELALTSLPSVSLGLALARRWNALGSRRIGDADGDLCLFGTLDPGVEVRDALGGERVIAYPFDEESAAGLLAPFSPKRTRKLLGDACTPTATFALASELSKAAVVHFVAHGLYLNGRDRGATLALAPEDGGTSGLTTCDDVERNLELSGLVVLSACGTALGPKRLGDDDLAHLGGAFLRAGAAAVVLSRSQVGYGPTLELMEGLHARLAAGDPPAEALRRARADLKEDDPAGAFHRSQFQIVGLGMSLELPRR